MALFAALIIESRSLFDFALNYGKAFRKLSQSLFHLVNVSFSVNLWQWSIVFLRVIVLSLFILAQESYVWINCAHQHKSVFSKHFEPKAFKEDIFVEEIMRNLMVPQGDINHQILIKTFEQSEGKVAPVFLLDLGLANMHQFESSSNIVVEQTLFSLIYLFQG